MNQPRAPAQRRSQATLERIVRATEELLAEDGAEATTVKAVMEKAGVGPGSFYARFDGRDALLAYVQDRFWESVRAEWSEFTEETRWQGVPLAHRAGEIVRRLVRGHARHEARLRASLVHALRHPAEDAMERVLELDELLTERLVAVLSDAPADEGAIRVALLQLLSALRVLHLFPDATPLAFRYSEEDLITRLTRNLLLGMGADDWPETFPDLLQNSARLYRT